MTETIPCGVIAFLNTTFYTLLLSYFFFFFLLSPSFFSFSFFSFFFLFFFLWYYSPWRNVASSKIVLHCSRSCDLRHHLYIFLNQPKATSTTYSHLKYPYSFCMFHVACQILLFSNYFNSLLFRLVSPTRDVTHHMTYYLYSIPL